MTVTDPLAISKQPRGQMLRVFIVFAVITSLAMMARPAKAQEATADVEAYCKKTYGAATLGTFDRRDNGPMCSERTNQGPGLLHHKINPADICQSQHQTSRFRKEGRQIFCMTGSGSPDQNRKVDLADYCRKNYGQSAIVSKRLTDNASLCTVKGDGGLSQTHYAIDLAELCGKGGIVSPGAIDGDVLDCGKAGAMADANGRSKSAEGPGRGKPQSGERRPSGPKRPGRRARAEAPDSAFIKASDNPDLSGCGNIQDKQSFSTLFRNTEGRGGWGWLFGGVDTPCLGLGKGLAVDLDEFCRQTQEGDFYGHYKFALLDSRRPMCIPPLFDPPYLEASFSGSGLDLNWACRHVYPGELKELRTHSDTGTMISIIKFAGGKLECFYLDVTAPAEPEVFVEVET